MVTTVSIAGAQEWQLGEYAEQMRAWVEALATDGTLTWQTMRESAGDLLYGWTLEDDAAVVDQLEVVRLLRGRSGLHSMHYAARGPMESLGSAREAWLARLERASVTYQSGPARPIPDAVPAADEAHPLIDALQGTPPGTERVALIRRAIALTDKAVAAERWARLHALLGTEVMRAPGEDRAADIAIAAYRNALEVLTRETDIESWAATMVALSAAFAVRAASTEPHAADLRHSAATLEHALSAFAEGSLELLRLLLELGDVFRNVSPKAALQAYGKVLTELEAGSYSRPGDEDNEAELVQLAQRVWSGVTRIDWASEEPPIPEGSYDPDRGVAILLRPLLSAGHLTITNGFRRQPSRRMPLDRDSEEITLEAALHSALGPHVHFYGLGGRPEGYGAGRFIILGTGDEDLWQTIAEVMIHDADAVIVVPHASAGVSWEIDLLIAQRWLRKTLFVMPPPASDLDVPTMWAEATAMMAAHSLELPDYDPGGLIFQLDPPGTVVNRWPFETVWTGTLVHHLDHLLPRDKSDPAGQQSG